MTVVQLAIKNSMWTKGPFRKHYWGVEAFFIFAGEWAPLPSSENWQNLGTLPPQHTYYMYTTYSNSPYIWNWFLAKSRCLPPFHERLTKSGHLPLQWIVKYGHPLKSLHPSPVMFYEWSLKYFTVCLRLSIYQSIRSGQALEGRDRYVLNIIEFNTNVSI